MTDMRPTSLSLMPAPKQDLVLSADEQVQLFKLEQDIEPKLRGLFDAAQRLLVIQRERLYRADYKTFEDYLEDRWGMGRTNGQYLMVAAAVSENLALINTKYPRPTAPRQVRDLADFSPEEQREIWIEACEAEGDGRVPTSKRVEAIAEARRAARGDTGAPKKRGRPRGTAPAAPAAKKPVNNEWYTPEKYIDAVRKALGGSIDLDPASCDEAQAVVQASEYFTAEDDGLQYMWEANTVFMNPPYESRLIGQFVRKFYKAYDDNDFEHGIMLVNVRPDSPWFHVAFDASAVCFVNHRIRFVRPAAAAVDEPELDENDDQDDEDGDGTDPKKALPQNGYCASVFLYYGDEKERFVEAFKRFGPCITMLRLDEPDIDVIPM